MCSNSLCKSSCWTWQIWLEPGLNFSNLAYPYRPTAQGWAWSHLKASCHILHQPCWNFPARSITLGYVIEKVLGEMFSGVGVVHFELEVESWLELKLYVSWVRELVFQRCKHQLCRCYSFITAHKRIDKWVLQSVSELCTWGNEGDSRKMQWECSYSLWFWVIRIGWNCSVGQPHLCMKNRRHWLLKNCCMYCNSSLFSVDGFKWFPAMCLICFHTKRWLCATVL